ncbi:MAG: hypothetical protein WC877_01525 [Dehalococcoidales bacterium]
MCEKVKIIKFIDFIDDERLFDDENGIIWKLIRPLVVDDFTIVFDFIGIVSVSPRFLSQVVTKPLIILSVEEYCKNIRFKRIQNELTERLLINSINNNIQKYSSPRLMLK